MINNSKKQYHDAYLYTESDRTQSDFGGLTYFIKYNLDCIKKALENILEYLERKQKEQSQAMEIITKSGDLTLRQAEILKQFLKTPENPITIKEVVTTFNVAYATARSDLFTLEKLSYVEKRMVGKEFIFVFK